MSEVSALVVESRDLDDKVRVSRVVVKLFVLLKSRDVTVTVGENVTDATFCCRFENLDFFKLLLLLKTEELLLSDTDAFSLLPASSFLFFICIESERCPNLLVAVFVLLDGFSLFLFG